MALSRNMNNIFKKMLLRAIYITDKFFQPLYREKFFSTELSVFKYFTFIGKRQINSGIKVSQITQTRSQNIKFINYIRKYIRIRPECYYRSGLFGSPDNLYIMQRFSARKLLHIYFPVTLYLRTQISRQSIYTRYADPM